MRAASSKECHCIPARRRAHTIFFSTFESFHLGEPVRRQRFLACCRSFFSACPSSLTTREKAGGARRQTPGLLASRLSSIRLFHSALCSLVSDCEGEGWGVEKDKKVLAFRPTSALSPTQATPPNATLPPLPAFLAFRTHTTDSISSKPPHSPTIANAI